MDYKKALKTLEELCCDKMAETKTFDKFWVQGTCMRTFKTIEQVQFIITKLEGINDTDSNKVEQKFEKIISVLSD